MTTAVQRPTVTPGAREVPERPSQSAPWSRGHRAAWMRLGGVMLLAALSELLYVGYWPISYYLTQGPDFTYEYLLQYRPVWDRLLPLLLRLEATWPDAPRSLEFMVDALTRAFAASFALYLAALWLVRQGLPSRWGTIAVVGPAVAFQITLFLMPGVFTTDLFSYVMYGQIAGPYELNPYIHLPAYFPQSRIFQWIHPLWHYAPSVYGPAWIDLSVPLARAVAGWSEVDRVLAYKLLVNLAHIGGIGCLALLVHRVRPGQVLPSVLLYTWNPMILFEFAGNGHNDAVMVLLMLLALLFFSMRSRPLGVGALTLALLMKMAAILLLPYYVVAWARERGTTREFLLTALISGIIVLVITVGLYLPWWVGIETLGPILVWSQGPLYNNYALDIVSQFLALEYLRNPMDADPWSGLEQARGWVKVVVRPIFVAFCLWELIHVRTALGVAGATVRVMLAFLLLFNTWVLPWYFTWPVAFAAVLGWDSITAKLSIGFSISALLVMYHRHFWHPFAGDGTYLLYLAPLLILPLYWLPRVSGRRAELVSRWRCARATLGSSEVRTARHG